MFRVTIRRLQNPLDLNSYRTISVFTSRQQKPISVTVHDQNIGTSVDVEKNPASLDLYDYKTAFKHRKLSEIVRALIIFKLCTYDTLVRNSLSVWRHLILSMFEQYVAAIWINCLDVNTNVTLSVWNLILIQFKPIISVWSKSDLDWRWNNRGIWFDNCFETFIYLIT